MNWTCVLLIGLFIALFASQSIGREDVFDTELEFLRQQNLPAVGRQAYTAAYERFIQRHSADPRVAIAMLDLADSLENTIASAEIHADSKAALEWRRRAAATASPRSEAWIKAQFLIATNFANSDESRRILDLLAQECSDDLSVLSRVEYYLVLLCITRGDFEEAEIHTLAVMNWYDDPNRIPRDEVIKAEIDVRRLTAGGAMMHAWSTAPWPRAERNRKIQEFMDRYALNGGNLLRDGEAALKRVDENPNPEGVGRTMSAIPQSIVRLILIAANAIIVLALISVWIYRRWLRPSA
jgi:hypothetical protein